MSFLLLMGCFSRRPPSNPRNGITLMEIREDSRIERKFSALQNARVVAWEYPVDITREEAEKQADKYKNEGITHILTEGHRYIMYDLEDTDNPPEFLFTPQKKEKSIKATKLVTDVLHERGIYCLHHVTCTYATRDFMEQHREWTQRDARFPEDPVFFEMYGGVYIFCLNNPEFREEFFQTVIDITKRTGVDGWMIDEVEWLPTWYACGCKYCRAKFFEETGYELPSDPVSPVWENFENPVWRAWLRWRMKSAGDFFVDLKARLDAEVPGQILTACHAGASDTWLAQKWGMDIIELRRGLNWIFYEAFIRKGMDFYNWRRHLAELRLYKAIARPTEVSPLALFYPESPAESRFYWALNSLAGARTWAEFHFKKEFQYPDFFTWQRDHEFLYNNQRQLANIALLFSKQTRDALGFDTKYYVDKWGGWAEILNEKNIPHVAIIESDLSGDYISNFDLVIVPHAVCLSKEQIRTLLRYTFLGGNLIITGDTGIRNENGQRRDDLTSVRRLREESLYIEDNPGLDAEMNFLRLGEPFEYERELRFLKFGEPFHDERNQMAIDLITESVEKTVGEPLDFRVNAPTGVIANAFILKDGSVTIHLLNATGADMEDEFVLTEPEYPVKFPPVEDIDINLRMDDKSSTVCIAKLYSPYGIEGEELDISIEDEQYKISLPELKFYSVIHVKMNL